MSSYLHDTPVNNCLPKLQVVLGHLHNVLIHTVFPTHGQWTMKDCEEYFTYKQQVLLPGTGFKPMETRNIDTWGKSLEGKSCILCRQAGIWYLTKDSTLLHTLHVFVYMYSYIKVITRCFQLQNESD